MTRQRDFKALVRERMQKTGEHYTAARAQLLKKAATAPSPKPDYPGVVAGYAHFGGVQSDTGLLHNLLFQAGVENPITTQPYSEAFLNGMCGGVGFLYAVFEYRGMPPILTVVARAKSMPDTFLADIADRLGLITERHTTTSAKAAAKALDDALAAGRPAKCIVDTAHLPYHGVPPQLAGMYPQGVAVVGRDGDDVWLDDRAVTPIRISLQQLAAARAGYKKEKHLLVTLKGARSGVDLKAAMRTALQTTIAALRDGDAGVPDSFRANCGFAGMSKWQKLLTDAKDKKGWPQVFREGERAYAGLRRAYDCVQYDYTAPAAGRAFYADFLDEAALQLDDSRLSAAATRFRAAGEKWAGFAARISACGDAAVERGCEISNLRAELIDTRGGDAAMEMAALWRERQSLGAKCALAPDAACAIYADLAAILGEIIAIEREAVGALERAV